MLRLLLIAGFLLAASSSQAHNHPKGLTGAAKTQALSNTINAYSLAWAIEKHIKKEVKIRGGRYSYFDAKKNKGLGLTLQKVHHENLCHLGGDSYFACADFMAQDGIMYDLDVFMRGKDANNLEVTRVMLHKENNELRYDWEVVAGKWRQVPVKKTSNDKKK